MKRESGTGKHAPYANLQML